VSLIRGVLISQCNLHWDQMRCPVFTGCPHFAGLLLTGFIVQVSGGEKDLSGPSDQDGANQARWGRPRQFILQQRRCAIMQACAA
jgi:hypothetical protein